MKTGNTTFFIILAVLAGVVIYFLAPILTPFLVGALLAYLVDPLVRQLMRLHMPRLLSVVIVFFSLFLFLTLLVLLLIPLIENQATLLIDVIPRVVAWLQNTIVPQLKEYFGIEELVNVDTLKASLADNWTKAGGLAAWLWKSVMHSGFALIEWVTNLLLIPVVTFYLLRDWNKVIHGVRDLLPRRIEPTVVKLTKSCNDVLSAFFRGQLLVMLGLGFIYSIGLSLIGLQIGLMIGLVAGLLSIVPYLGFITGIVAASIAAYVQFGTFTAVLLVWLVFMVGQAIESTLLTPNLVGNRIGLHPVAVIFAILTGGSLFGFFGVLLALPVAAVTMVLIRFLNQHYHNSPLYR
jgi:predicted PurR-regulated permease PerM